MEVINPMCNGLISTNTLSCTDSIQGTCYSPNLCNQGYFGKACELYTCGNINLDNKNICSSRGS
jgi:hypothetical protein